MRKVFKPTPPNARVDIPDSLRAFVDQLAKDAECDGAWGLKLLIRRLNRMVMEGEIKQLGPDFADAYRNLNATPQPGHLAPHIDFAMLQHSPKVKSGFEGVYANGKGFRAVGPQPGGGTVTLGTFPTAEEAAWARYLHHKRLGIAYGNLTKWIEAARRLVPEQTRAQVIAGAANFNGQEVTLDQYLRHTAIFEAAKAGEIFGGLAEEERVFEKVDPIAYHFPATDEERAHRLQPMPTKVKASIAAAFRRYRQPAEPMTRADLESTFQIEDAEVLP